MSKQENQFRIGGVYRNNQGTAVRLFEIPEGGRLGVASCSAHGGSERFPLAYHDLATGRSRLGAGNPKHYTNLIPGELTQTPSGWVALGAEKQANTFVTVEQDLRDMQQILDGVLRDGEPTSADLAMIARDGAAKPKTYAPFTPMVTFADEPVSTAKPNPFAAFRSPDCDSGPSDHLNASRHQMAAKQFHKA